MFDWKREVPVWVVLRYAQIKAAWTVNGRRNSSIRMSGWKATPKGGKLSYIIGESNYEVQFYK